MAQSLSVLLGNSVLQYSFTFGVFLTALGFGALAAPVNAPEHRLLQVQIFLFSFAPLAFCALWLALLGVPHFLLAGFSYLVVATLGFATGMEVPLLMALGGVRSRLHILSWDYFGMLVASVAFPLFLLPKLGVFATILFAALLNGAVVQSLLPGGLNWRRGLIFSISIVHLILLYSQESILGWLSTQFIANAG